MQVNSKKILLLKCIDLFVATKCCCETVSLDLRKLICQLSQVEKDHPPRTLAATTTGESAASKDKYCCGLFACFDLEVVEVRVLPSSVRCVALNLFKLFIFNLFGSLNGVKI